MSHMGIYSADEDFLNISFKETTIIRRMNVHGIKLRIMVVVSVYKKYIFILVPQSFWFRAANSLEECFHALVQNGLVAPLYESVIDLVELNSECAVQP